MYICCTHIREAGGPPEISHTPRQYGNEGFKGESLTHHDSMVMRGLRENLNWVPCL